jgi:hypothetical protein
MQDDRRAHAKKSKINVMAGARPGDPDGIRVDADMRER